MPGPCPPSTSPGACVTSRHCAGSSLARHACRVHRPSAPPESGRRRGARARPLLPRTARARRPGRVGARRRRPRARRRSADHQRRPAPRGAAVGGRVPAPRRRPRIPRGHHGPDGPGGVRRLAGARVGAGHRGAAEHRLHGPDAPLHARGLRRHRARDRRRVRGPPARGGRRAARPADAGRRRRPGAARADAVPRADGRRAARRGGSGDRPGGARVPRHRVDDLHVGHDRAVEGRAHAVGGDLPDVVVGAGRRDPPGRGPVLRAPDVPHLGEVGLHRRARPRRPLRHPRPVQRGPVLGRRPPDRLLGGHDGRAAHGAAPRASHPAPTTPTTRCGPSCSDR